MARGLRMMFGSELFAGTITERPTGRTSGGGSPCRPCRGCRARVKFPGGSLPMSVRVSMPSRRSASAWSSACSTTPPQNDQLYGTTMPTFIAAAYAGRRRQARARLASTALFEEGLAELHTHLGGSVASDILWSLAHEQGIALPVKDYWEFDRLVTVSDPRGVANLDALDAIYHWTELIQSSPLAVERSVHAAIGGAYRSQRITTLELRFNPMKRNRGGERDLDHIILAAIRGLDRASLEYPQVRAGPDPDDGPDVQPRPERDHRREGDPLGSARRRRHRHRRPAAGRRALRVPPDRAARGGGARGRPRRHDPRRRGGRRDRPATRSREVVEYLRPDRIGHGILAAGDPELMGDLREAGIVLEICPTSNLLTKALPDEAAVRDTFRAFVDHGVPFTIATDGPEMMRTHLRDEFELLLRIGALDEDELAEAKRAGTCRVASSSRASSSARRSARNTPFGQFRARSRRW